MTLDPLEVILWGAAFVLELRSRIIQIGWETKGRHCSVANDLDKKETTDSQERRLS
jgi:hypothetical protein